MKLFDKNYTKNDIEKNTGNLNQVGGTRHYQLTEGYSKGTRAIDVNTGSGFSFTILPDRGLDISLASYRGINLVYQTPNGEANPAFFNTSGSEWLRTFFAGLLTTCGLTNIGAPVKDNGEELGLHGRYSNTPASKVCDLSHWKKDEYLINISGEILDSILFGSKLKLHRNISSSIGISSFIIHDTVENYGVDDSPFTILYHINAGFPLLAEGSRLIVSSEHMEPYDGISEKNIQSHNRILSPQGLTEELNYLHKMKSDREGYGYAAVINDNLLDGIGLYIKFKTDTLPYLSVWKMMGDVDYVAAIEPCNVKCENRKTLRENGLLPYLKKNRSISTEVEIGVLYGNSEICSFDQMVSNM